MFLFVVNREKVSLNYNFIQNWKIPFNAVSGQNKTKEEDVLFTLYIPGINLEEKVYTMDSDKNHVDYHVQILDGSDINKNFLFLAAHSGIGKASYFNRLVELGVGDIIWIDKGYEKKYFMVESLFYITKNGYLEYSTLEIQNKLYLFTCSLEYLDKQYVVIASLVD